MCRLLSTGWLSYRGLLGWLRPPSFVASKVVAPLSQLLLLVLLGTQLSQTGDAPFFLVGGALLMTARGGVYGVILTLDTARLTGLRAYQAVAPASILRLAAATVVFNLVDGLITGLLLFAAGAILLHVELAAWGGVLVATLATAASASALGVLGAQLSLAMGDKGGLVMNVLFLATFMLSGATLPRSDLPACLRELSAVWPLSHGIEAARAAVASRPWANGCLIELGLAVAVAGFAMVLARRIEQRGRRRGALDQGA